MYPQDDLDRMVEEARDIETRTLYSPQIQRLWADPAAKRRPLGRPKLRPIPGANFAVNMLDLPAMGDLGATR